MPPRAGFRRSHRVRSEQSAAPFAPFPLHQLTPEIILWISTYWSGTCALGLPTTCLNRLLYSILLDPVAIAAHALRRFYARSKKHS
ncbi:hypothetical protein M427DRAFT_54781 [Gonapodya prolifera JEL478]|uniref:Uncharacterized protein n=1 Tax=Gonapodya prolifera (strain JEL478) TaxID=1344416 RepID=A0A139AK17_GONPJ|nr:hypothetical protein M427DRAFT_54781 [Gonapodya prolifera JEL478]|eukprot:KXS17126.1 hypothetical protein M427DRAFT_54781 [Gonapodya prolifera JEL478]